MIPLHIGYPEVRVASVTHLLAYGFKQQVATRDRPPSPTPLTPLSGFSLLLGLQGLMLSYPRKQCLGSFGR